MLPKYAKVKNFTSYVDEIINFENFGNIFAVIGENGAGKSSLIEMITTAIFYNARGVDGKGSGMDDLIHKDADRFEIEYVFTMNGAEYKIFCAKNRGGARELDLYIDGIKQSEKVTETQEKINDIMKLNYDTFIDTVCIGQGKSGSFMEKKPNERKEVFVQVLGLSKYKDLEKYTKELRDKVKNDIEFYELQYNNFLEKTQSKEEQEQKIADSEQQISAINKDITAKEEELELMLKRKAQYEMIKQQSEHILTQRATLSNKVKTIQATLASEEELQENLKNIIEQKIAYDMKVEKLQKDYDNYQTQYNEISTQKSNLETTNDMMIKQRENLLQQKKSLYHRIHSSKQNLFKNRELQITLVSVVEKKPEYESKLGELQDKYDASQQRHQELSNQKSNLEATNEMIVKQAKEIKAKYDKLNDFNEAECSLCGHEITEEYKSTHLKELMKQGKELIGEVNANKTKIAEIETEMQELVDAMDTAKSDLATCREKYNKIIQGESKLTQVNSSIDELQQAIVKDRREYLSELRGNGKNNETIISNNETEIKQLRSKILEIGNLFTETKSELNTSREKYNKILQAESKLTQVEKHVDELQKSLEETQKEYADNLKIEIQEVEEQIFNDNLLKSQIQDLRDEVTHYQSIISIAKNELENIRKSEEGMKGIEDKVKELKILFEDYNDLMVAWGKSGIQAAIIENSLPEIEDEINNMLTLLSDGRATVEFITQKETKSKKKASIETLDILIKDENGARKYETYSGGEKFRVDFACHVGLAKFLAKRAGASIDFFIVDEGLGSQDDNARAAFIQCTNKLTKLFKQIMVITHINEMKEAFDHKIVVEKHPIYGSKVRKL